MLELSIFLPTEEATAALGWRLAPLLRAGDVIALSGPLGAGKTALARALIAALTGKGDAPSPTFALVETYETPDFPLHHFDLYRLEKAEDVWELGFEDALDGVVIIEWPERIKRLIPDAALLIRLSMDGDARRALVRGGDEWAQRLSGLNPD